MEFNRFDICEAYYMYEVLWHSGGMTLRDWNRAKRRPNNRPESIGVQLNRIQFRPAPSLDLESLTANGLMIYTQLVTRYDHEIDQEAERLLLVKLEEEG